MNRAESKRKTARVADDSILAALGRSDLSGAEAQAAAYIRDNVAKITRMSVADASGAAGVSEPTIIRLCRRLGCEGFTDLKIRLVQGLASGTPYVHRDVAIDDGLGVSVEKVIESTIRAVADSRDWLDMAALEAAVELLASANRIDCYGVGLASAWALDAQIRLMRLGVPAIWYPDSHTQAMAAAGARRGDVVLVLTVRGEALDLIRAAEIARSNGAKVIGIARNGSPLAEVCDVFLGLESAENTEIYTPSQSRLLVLLLVDLLTTGLMLRLGPQVIKRLRMVKESVESMHMRSKPRSKARAPHGY